MTKYVCYFLLLTGMAFLALSCQSSRQSDVAVSVTNSAAAPTEKSSPASGAPAASGKSAETNRAETRPPNDDVKNSPAESTDASSAAKFENRCGWFSNPTPANAWLEDKDGEWIISIQGGYQAEGDYPNFKPEQWIETNGSYGYGCACLRVKVDRKNMRILEIAGANAKALADCRRDPALKEPKN